MFRYPDKPMSQLSFDALDELPETYIAQLKLDGWRCQIDKTPGGLMCTSRHAKPIPISDSLRAELADQLAALPFGTRLDAEWLARRPGYRTEALWIFDILALGARELYCHTTAERLGILEQALPQSLIPPMVCRGYSTFFDAMQDRPEAEGIVLKRRDARYIGSYRSSALNPGWVKCKWRAGEDGMTTIRARAAIA